MLEVEASFTFGQEEKEETEAERKRSLLIQRINPKEQSKGLFFLHDLTRREKWRVDALAPS